MFPFVKKTYGFASRLAKKVNDIHMKRLFLGIFSVLTIASCARYDDVYMYDDTVSESWSEIADQTTETLIDRFWNEQGYFNYGSNESDLTFHYWPNAHAMDVVIDAYLRTSDSRYSAYFSPWFEGMEVMNGGDYYNEFYDDMQWNALTMLRLYEITNEQKYMDAVILLWEDIVPAWNEEYAGGGMAWRKSWPYSKNACSNGPASVLAARLYNTTGDPVYLEWAKRIYDWQKEVLYDRVTGAVFDNINGRTDVIDPVVLTYNQGTFLGTAVELYKITGDDVYMVDAIKIANHTLTKCIDPSNNVLRDEGGGDGALFKGIFIRYFVDFLKLDGIDQLYRSKFENFLINNARIAWLDGTDRQILLFGPSWSQVPAGNVELTAQTSAAMLFECTSDYFE